MSYAIDFIELKRLPDLQIRRRPGVRHHAGQRPLLLGDDAPLSGILRRHHRQTEHTRGVLSRLPPQF
jgi:hypothetical protein